MSNKELLNPQNSALILIDFQPQMVFGVANIDRQTLFNNVMLLAKAAKIFKVPTILTTRRVEKFFGLHVAATPRPFSRTGARRTEFDEFVGRREAGCGSESDR